MKTQIRFKTTLSSSETSTMSSSSSASSSSSYSPSHSPPFLFSYIKLRFFKRLQKFLRSKKTSLKSHPVAADPFLSTIKTMNNQPTQPLQNQLITEDKKDDDPPLDLQRVVKSLHFGSWEEKEVAAEAVEKLARGDYSKLRKLMEDLGVLPPLISMMNSDVPDRRRVARKALIELANGSSSNKALMGEAGILSKIPISIEAMDEAEKLQTLQLLFSLSSSLSNTHFCLASTKKIIPFLQSILDSDSTVEAKESSLATLHNLSTALDKASALASNGLVETLLRLSSKKEFSEKLLLTLANLIVPLAGKKAIESSDIAAERLMEILTWEEKPKSQEISAYILTVLAHQSSKQRAKMATLGIVPVLIEVALLGSRLAQERALKLLRWFKDDRESRMGPYSGPQIRVAEMAWPLMNQREAQEGKKMVKKLVKESLCKNMEMITKRANGGGECSKLKTLVLTTSSKSLPY